MNPLTALLLLLAVPKHHAATLPTSPLDASWVTTVASASPERRINTDPRFDSLVRRALPQRQWFWYDHHRLLSTASLVETFLGVTFGHQHLDENRFLTTDGCVPHDCLDTGLLWIDTAPGSTQLIAAINPLVGGGPGSHLWLFTSDQRFNWQKPGSNFLASLKTWLAAHSDNSVSIITIVRPDGVQSDLAPSELLDPPHFPTTGAPK